VRGLKVECCSCVSEGGCENRSEQQAAGSRQRAAGSGQQAASSGQRAASSGQRAGGSKQQQAAAGSSGQLLITSRAAGLERQISVGFSIEAEEWDDWPVGGGNRLMIYGD